MTLYETANYFLYIEGYFDHLEQPHQFWYVGQAVRNYSRIVQGRRRPFRYYLTKNQNVQALFTLQDALNISHQVQIRLDNLHDEALETADWHVGFHLADAALALQHGHIISGGRRRVTGRQRLYGPARINRNAVAGQLTNLILLKTQEIWRQLRREYDEEMNARYT